MLSQINEPEDKEIVSFPLSLSLSLSPLSSPRSPGSCPYGFFQEARSADALLVERGGETIRLGSSIRERGKGAEEWIEAWTQREGLRGRDGGTIIHHCSFSFMPSQVSAM